MKIALAHDSFTQIGGAERIAATLHELYPDAEYHTIVVDSRLNSFVAGWKIHTTVIQALYNIYPRFQQLFPLIPVALYLQPKIKADILISSSSSYAKGFRVGPNTIHINYCHTPTRFVWGDFDYALQEIPAFLRPVAKQYFRWLRKWDKWTTKDIDYFIANSKEVQSRIKQYYGRNSDIVYPYVEMSFWHATKPKQDYFLIAGRLQPYKGHDTVIRACTEAGLRLHVVGTGRYETYLRSIAGPNIAFLGRVSDEQLRDEYSGAKAFLYPQLEDFGMMPLEAAACGTATIGLAMGGSLETIAPGISGELLPEITVDSLKACLASWQPEKYNTEAMRQHANKFSKQQFKQKIQELVNHAQSL